MAEPGTDPASSQSAPPLLQTEAADKGGPWPASPPAQNQTAPQTAAGQPPPPSQEVFAATDAEKQPPAPPPPPPLPPSRAPSQERVAAADAEKQPPAPAAPPPPLLDNGAAKEASSSVRKDEGDASMTKPRTSLWTKLRSAVLWLTSLFRLQRGDQLLTDPKISPPPSEEGGRKKNGAGDALAETAAEEKEKAKWSKRLRDDAEAEASAASGPKEKPAHQPEQRKSLKHTKSVPPRPPEPEAGVSVMPPPRRGDLLKKFRKAVRLVQCVMMWYRGSRSPPDEAPAPAPAPAHPEEVVDETKAPPTSAQEVAGKSKEDGAQAKPPEEKPHPLWSAVEKLLEKILEKSCTSMLAADFKNLDDKTRKCLLTFSVFKLDSEVKKQAVTYWWVAQFDLSSEPHRPGLQDSPGAEDIFAKLSRQGFLEPIRNPCSGVMHGCRVNPLVHWTVKLRAREEGFADLDDFGDPTDSQHKSGVFCLTADNRASWLQRLPKDDEGQARTKCSFCLHRQLLCRNCTCSYSRCCVGLAPHGCRRRLRKRGSAGQNSAKAHSEEEQHALELLGKLDKKKVILNVSAHVYRLPEPLLSKLARDLEVLQLGRWWNSDDETYMEVESLRAIGKLKNLRYLGLRGLAGLTELPEEVGALHQLAILDMRGCQKLVKVTTKAVTTLKKLTILDLTECYMLEHIGQGVIALSELRVFKGFVFAVGTASARRNACKLDDLAKLKKLRKLGVNVTTDAHLPKGEMAKLRNLAGLRSLTVTWGELPSILLDDSSRKGDLKNLLDKWTGLKLPQELEKLDVRCYPVVPKDHGGAGAALPWLWLEETKKLEKLYVRGGDVETLDIQRELDTITTLRLRYLKKFAMPWNDLRDKLIKLRYVEVVMKDPKVMKIEGPDPKDGEKVKEHTRKARLERQKKASAREEERKLMAETKERMKIPDSILDEDGVWVWDEKELEQDKKKPPEDDDAPGKAGDGGSRDGDDARTSPSSSDGQNKGKEEGEKQAEDGQDTRDSKQEVAGEVKKADGGDAGKAQTGGEEGRADKEPGTPEEEDEVPADEGGGDDDTHILQGKEEGAKQAEDGQETPDSEPEVAGEVNKADGGDTGGEEGGADEEPGTPEEEDDVPADEGGGDDDTSPDDATGMPASQPPELPRQLDEAAGPGGATDHDEEAVAPAGIPEASGSGAPGTALPPVPPATTGAPAPAAAGEATAKPKEPAEKADGDDGSTATATGA